MLIIIFILINMSIKIITEKYQGFLKTLEMMEISNLTEIKNYWYSINAIIVLSIVSIIVSMIILKKTGAVIEEEKGKYVLETVLKSFKLFCTTFAFLLIFYVLMVIVWSMIFMIYFSVSGTEKITLSSMKNISTINLFIFISITITAIIFILKMLYFVQMYFLRRISMYEALIYNFHLCKRNKLRIILPVILLVILNILFNLPSGILNFVTLFSKYKLLVVGISAILNSMLNIFYIILITVIYLNVEYMDLRKN